MPASVNETVNASLLLSLSTKCGPENGEIPLEQRMAAATKRVLHAGIEYEISNDTYHSSVLQGLKAKYAHEDTSLTNGSSCSNSSNAQGKGVVDSNNPSLPIPTKVLFPMEKVQMQWALQRNHPGSGFINAGNSCYLNSVLQALFHIPPMVNWLMDGDQQHQRCCNTFINSTTECIICCMAVTLKQSQQRPEQMRPHLILSRLRSICKRLIPGQQEDAMEFLRYLFEAMEKCYLYRYSGMKLDNSSKETTPLNQIFGGYIRTDVTCLHCKGVSTTFQHFLDLTLDISRGNSLEHALDIYFSQERLEGDNSYRCDKCRRKVPAAKQFFIERLPNVLCIQLKRFNIEGKKISKGIQLAERINLQRFLSRPKPLPGQHVQRPPRGACYRLQAGVNHLGHTAQSGHYTTVAYASNSNLYHFDDSCVQRVWSGRGFSGTDVYLLMYVLDSKQDNSRPVSSPSATATSQSLQNVANRNPTKPSVSPSFIPLQCRPKSGIILNQNPNKIIFNNSINPLRAKEPLVAPTRSPAELAKSPVATTTSNKFSKLVTSSVPINKNGMIPVSSPVKSNVQTPSPSPTFNRIPPKVQNGIVQVALSMPSLVPYSEEHSSGDEAESPLLNQPTTSKENLTAPITNGWTVTPCKNNQVKDAEPSKSDKHKLESNSGDPLKKLLPKLPESPKSIPKVNGLDHKDRKLNSPKVGQDNVKKLNKPVINGETVTLKKSCDVESSSVAESECSVRSTSSSWHVSPVVKSPEKEKETMQRSAQPMVPASEPHAATASWVVTSAPTSAEQSPGALSSTSPSSNACKEKQKEPSNGRKRTYSKRRSRSSSSSSSSSSTSSTDSGGKSSKHYKVWVERTKETIFESKEEKKKKNGGLKRPASSKESDTRSNVADELRKMSHTGYGGAQVSTWNGGRSVVERHAREDFYERRRQQQDESEYDPEMDGGRRKKMKTDHHYQKDEEHSGVNHFQQEADYRRNGDNRYQRQNDWDSRKNNNYYTKPYSSSNSKYKNWYSNQHHYSNNHHNRYHNNYKGGNNWSRYPHGKRRNDRDYDSRSHYRHHNSHRYNNR